MSDDFYIGWEARAAPGVGTLVRRVVPGLLVLALLAPVLLAGSQRMIGVSVFEWGNLKNFTGVLEAQPYPHLLVARPGNAAGQPAFSTYHLVSTWKFGLQPDAVAALNEKPVTLKGTLIYRATQTMIETRPEWIRAAGKSPAPAGLPQTVPLGRQSFVGEIVDSKCFLGVMNPGQLTPHRACAIRCLSGGVPPVLLVRRNDGPAIYLLLVSAEGKPVNKQVLDRVAEPLEITGEVERQGEWLILRADPSTYRRATRRTPNESNAAACAPKEMR
jgi:hypothetical protein